jgi:hypothetical protein
VLLFCTPVRIPLLSPGVLLSTERGGQLLPKMLAASFACSLVAGRENSPRPLSMLLSSPVLYTLIRSGLGTLAGYKRLHSYGRSVDLLCVNGVLSAPSALSPS